MAGLHQKLEMRQGQSLVMTPQLQQAIKLLQLSNIELSAFVEEELERNPLLERDERSDEPDAVELAPLEGRKELELDGSAHAEANDAVDVDADVLNSSDSKCDMAGMDPGMSSSWSGANKGGSFEGGDYDAAANTSREKSLSEHLQDQLTVAGADPVPRLIAAHLIDLADDDGYMRSDLDEIAERLGVDTVNVATTLEMLQGFEPAGIMARNLKECLALQLKDRDRLDPAMAKLVENLDRLAKHDYPALQSICGVDAEDLDDMIAELRSLTPKPGLAYGVDNTRAIEPDVFVRENPDGSWRIELNTDTLPRVLINQSYAAEINAVARSDEDKTFITECSQNASWLVKSLDQRARTILKVSSEIVRQQDLFLAKGVAFLRPLNLKTVADAIEMHESTVSRVTSNKYVATPRGLFELKYFFTSSIPSSGGGEAHSAEAVRYRIKALVEGETLDDIMSDDALVDRLRDEGIDIARRTVAKYREALNIPSSIQRRRVLKRAS